MAFKATPVIGIIFIFIWRSRGIIQREECQKQSGDVGLLHGQLLTQSWFP
jgi:hypothetical protein